MTESPPSTCKVLADRSVCCNQNCNQGRACHRRREPEPRTLLEWVFTYYVVACTVGTAVAAIATWSQL